MDSTIRKYISLTDFTICNSCSKTSDIYVFYLCLNLEY